MRSKILRTAFYELSISWSRVSQVFLSSDSKHTITWSTDTESLNIRRLDDRLRDLEAGKAKRHRKRRPKRRLDLSVPINLDIGRRSVSRKLLSNGSWDAHPDRPNPIAPHAYIHFHRLNTPEDIAAALNQSREFLQMRQLVAAMTRLRELRMFVDEETLDAIMDMAETTMGSTCVDDVVGMMLACARFRLSRRLRFLGRLSRLSIDQGYIKDMTIRELATMAISCAAILRHASSSTACMSTVTEESMPRATKSCESGSCVVDLQDVEELVATIIEELCCFRDIDEELENRLPSILLALRSVERLRLGISEWIEALAIKRG